MPALSRRKFGFAASAVALVAGAPARARFTGGEPMPVNEGLFANINGMPQWLAIRGRDLTNPVLLILHGGPGFPTSMMAPAFSAWEKDFTVVHWDQPGGGATYAKNLDRGQGPLTAERIAADGIAVVEFVRQRLHARKVVLLGNSWGTKLGVMMAQRRPALFSAYIGASQVADGAEGNRLGYELGLKEARERGDAAAVTALERVGPPPYATFEDFLVRQTYTNPPGLPPGPREVEATARLTRTASVQPPADAPWIAKGLPPQDFMKVFMETQRATFGSMDGWKASDYGLSFKIPVFIFQGDRDLNTPVGPVREWFEKIRAPTKAFHVIEGSGHNTLAFSDEILAVVERELLPLTRRT